jgi:hypothetical protein
MEMIRMGEMRNAYKILVGKPKGKMPFRRHRHRFQDNIKMDIRKVGWEGVDWNHVSEWGLVVSSCEHGNEPLSSIKGWEFDWQCVQSAPQGGFYPLEFSFPSISYIVFLFLLSFTFTPFLFLFSVLIHAFLCSGSQRAENYGNRKPVPLSIYQNGSQLPRRTCLTGSESAKV